MRKDKTPKSLYISFIMEPHKEDPNALLRVHKLLSDIFGSRSVSCITEGDDLAPVSREVIFSISTPVVVNNQVWEEWFKKLEQVFKCSEKYTPFFTNEEEK